MKGESGQYAAGVGVQSILWSDRDVFLRYSQSAGNSMMFLMTEYALQKAKEIGFETPMDLLDNILPLTHEYGKKITCNPDLRLTFALNALVAVDNAAWMLYARESGMTDFNQLIPLDVRPSLSFRHGRLAYENGIPCFCADLTVPPVMVDWNKNVAARLAPLAGLKAGVLETNGQQNYSRWREMETFHPCYGKEWMKINGGMFILDDDFYKQSGGILKSSEHYTSLVNT